MYQVFSQSSRKGRLLTVLGPDVLVLQRFEGVERLNDLFDWSIDCLASQPDVDFDALIGTHATVTLSTQPGERHFDGIVTEARWLGAGNNGHRYRLTLRPWFFLAGLRRNQRIFHNKTVVQILTELLGAYPGIGRLMVKLTADYPVLEYTVQFRETDLAFATRMMERHGISYHFQHEEGGHALVLTDVVDSHDSIGARPFRPDEGHHPDGLAHFWQWHPARRMTTGAIRLTDYNFKTPTAAMQVDRQGDAAYAQGQIESFDWPGDYLDQARGKVVAKLRVDAERGQDRRYEALGDVIGLGAGLRVTLSGDPVPGLGEDHLCLAASHSYSADDYGSAASAGEVRAYAGRYLLMPATAPLLPERKTPRADVRGPQTAVVVGEGEIDCDEYGRILVRFHWDLDAAYSMRCRVSQSWAGPGWGGMVIPRIGMEVVVEFLDGDPDQPLVTGCVYNGRNAAPWPLPEHKTKSVFRTQTHQGKGHNELYFDDATQDERIYLHAEKDHEVHVRNNHAKRVDVSEVESVGNSKYSEVGRNLTLQVGGDAIMAVGVSDVQLNAPRRMERYDEGPLRLAYDLTEKSAPSAKSGNYRLMVAQAKVETVGTDSTTRVGRALNHTVGTSFLLETGADKTERTGKDSYETVGGGRYMHVQDIIDLRCGAARFVMKRNGDIEITGNHIKVNGKRIDLN